MTSFTPKSATMDPNEFKINPNRLVSARIQSNSTSGGWAAADVNEGKPLEEATVVKFLRTH
jgi:hypothetical protein